MNTNMFLAFFICLTALVGESLANQFTFETPLWTCPAPFIDSLKIQLDDIRYKYNVPFLTHSPEMDLEAQIWSSQLMVVNRAEENPNTPYGQTIFRGVAPGNQNKLTVDMELEILKMGQSEYYAYYMGEPMPYDIETTKNFAQTVWKATSKFGVGCSAGNLNGETVLFVVVYFDPKGLVKGQYRQNVHPKFDWIRFNAPMYGCPDDFQYNFIRRLNDDRSLYLDAKRVTINTTLRNIAQLESDRMSLLNQGLGTVQLSKQYGTLIFLKENENYNWVDVYPRYPLYDWGAKTPEYLLDDGSVMSFSEEKWIKPMDIGLGCTTRRFGMKSILIMVALFWDSIDRRKLCPTPKPTTTTTTTTTTTVQPSTTTVQPTSTTTVQPSTTTVQPSTTTVQPSTTTVQPSTTTVKPSTTTVQPTKTLRPHPHPTKPVYTTTTNRY